MINKSPQAVNGVLDLSDCNFTNQDLIKLDGEWEFYWNQLLEPTNFIDQKNLSSVEFATVPGKWKHYKLASGATGEGYATYRLHIKLYESGRYLAIMLPEVATAYNLYVNGKLLRSVGIVGAESRESSPRYLPQIVSFYADKQDIDLLIQVSNFAHDKGGIKSSLAIGPDETVHKVREGKLGIQFFLVGIFFIMTVYHFGIYLLRRTDKSVLYFGLFCLLIAIRTMVIGEMTLLSIFPSLDWEILLKIEYLSYYLAVPVFIELIYHLYGYGASRQIVNFFKVVSLLCSGQVIFSPVKYFAGTLPFYHGITLLACLYVGILMFKALREGKDGASSFVLGGFIILGTAINDILFSKDMISTGDMMPLGLFVFIFFQALALSTRFSRAYTTLEKLSVELTYSNNKITHILESIQDSFFALDNEARFTYVNQAAEDLLQKSQEQLLGNVLWDEIPQLKETVAYREYKEAVSNNRPVQFEIFSEIINQWVEVNAYPSQEGLSVFIRNIQERRQQQEKIREYTKMLEEQVRLLDLDPDYTFELNLDGVIIFWNHGAELGYNWTKEEAVGEIASVLLHTQLPQSRQEINEELMEYGRWMGELAQTKRDGGLIIVRSCWLLKKDVNGKPVGILEMNKDITDQKNMENEMVRLDRLKLIGQMAAGIAHEIRNPMTTVRGFLQLLSVKEYNARYKDYYMLMLSEMDRANEILNEYLLVASLKTPDFKFQDLNKILNSLQPLLQADASKLGKKIVFTMNEIPMILLNDSEIRQLILNLCRNGLEAMVNGGETLWITTACKGEEVVLSVQDEGAGIPQEMMEKLGTPFLTTKDNGTGLGLVVCYGIVTRHGATIEVSSSSEGTVFLIKFKVNSNTL